MIHPTAKVYEGVNGKLPARNTRVQLSTLYTGECHDAQSYRRTHKQTDGQTTL